MGTPADASKLRPVTPLGLVAAELAGVIDAFGAEPIGERPSKHSTMICGEAAPLSHDGPTSPRTSSAEVSGVADEVRTRLLRAYSLAAGLEPYLARCTTPETPALRQLAERTAEADWGNGPLEAEMLSGHVEGRFLALLVRITGARRVLEIGLFTGYSALAMAEALPADGVLVACELDAGAAAFAAAALADAPGGDRVQVMVGPAEATLADLADAGEPFDLVFIDADKSGYSGYLDQLLDSGLLARGALVCVDNTLLQGEPYSARVPSSNGAAIAAFNRRVADDGRVEQVVLPLRDGLTLIRRIDTS